jgi:bidirectional [NiFe] hydrogenase diaphorase subunit
MNVDDVAELARRYQAEAGATEREVRVCMATACHSSGAPAVLDALKASCGGQAEGCQVTGVGCMGLCSAGPMVAIAPPGADLRSATLYRDVTVEDARSFGDPSGDTALEHRRTSTEQPFFQRQRWIVRENSGLIDPDRIQPYVAIGGYQTLVRALTELTPAEVIAEVTDSGLRGRGGGGYPTGLKWSTVAKMPGEPKYVVCNADEGDPGAFMDRAILESDPHRLLESMAIAAYAVRANYGYIYIRAEYPLAVQRLKSAIREAKRHGFLGNHIAETPFSFEVELRLGAGAFVCGEETALMASIEGNRGQPHPRPPYPAEHGLWGQPTLINNVETFANIVPILREGGQWFASIGTEGSTGTKVFALAGNIQNGGLIEVDMGISLREVIEAIGGGIPGGKAVKAVQTGGPSGGCVPAAELDVPVDYDSLKRVGTMMGSGGMIVMDESSSMIDVARYFMEFCMSESCGKCVPCRTGTQQMHDLLGRLAAGTGTRGDLELLEELCEVVQATSLCGLGQTAPSPVISTLRYFRHEYEAQLREPIPD